MVPRYKIWFFAMNELCWFQRNYTLRDQLTGRCPGKIHLFWVDVSPLKELVGFPASYVSLPGGTFNNKKEFLWPWVAFFFEKKSRTSSRYPEVFFFDGDSWCEKISNDSSCFHVNICFTVRSPGGSKLLFQPRFRRCKTNHEVFFSAQRWSSSHVHQQPSKDALIDQASKYLVFTTASSSVEHLLLRNFLSKFEFSSSFQNPAN